MVKTLYTENDRSIDIWPVLCWKWYVIWHL